MSRPSDYEAYEVRLKTTFITEILEKFAVVSAAYDSSERYDEHSFCMAGTRDAVLHAIAQWTQSNDPHRMCWLSGKAGTGKSSIARSIAARCHDEQRLGFSFFFSQRNRARNDVTKLIPTLAYQLSLFFPAVRGSLTRVVERNPRVFHQNLRTQFTQLVVDPLLSIVDSLPTMILVIDGLDEYSGPIPLVDLVSLFRDLPDRFPFRIFITSRPEPRILEILNSPSMIWQTYHLNLQDFSSPNEVHSFLHSQLLAVRDTRGLPSDWPSTNDLNRLSEQSDGLFIYASTLVKFIDAEYGDPVEKLQSALNAHSGMDHLYDQILLEARRYPAFAQVVGSIIYLALPLSIHALVDLLQLPSHRIRFALRGCFSILAIPDNDADYVRPYHVSLQAFLTDRDRAKEHFLDPLEYNQSIMDNCVELLHGSLAIDAEGRESLLYACRYWCHHLRMVVSCTSGVDHVRWDAKTIELMKNLQSRWLKNWILILENLQNVKNVHEDLSVIVAQFEESSTVFPELQKLFETVNKFLETPQWIIDDLTDKYSDSEQLPEIPEALPDEAFQRPALQGGPSIPAQRSILSALNEDELFDDSVIDGDARISRISKIAVHHCGTVYKLEVHYILNNQTTVVREHGDPTISRSELVNDAIALGGVYPCRLECVIAESSPRRLGAASRSARHRIAWFDLAAEIHFAISLIKHPIGPYGGNAGDNIWPGIYRFRAMGNIIAFGGSTGFGTHRVSTQHWSDLIQGRAGMLTGLSFITDGRSLKLELGSVGHDLGDLMT